MPTHARHIKELDLSDNQISYIHPDTFAGFKNLKVLNLSQNNLQNFDNIFHADLGESLEFLYLDRNPAKDIINSVFENLTNLKFLSLRGVNLTVMSRRTFNGLYRLLELKMDHSNLTHLPNDWINQLS